MRTMSELDRLPGLEEHLARWVVDGVVTPAQADLIRAEEQSLVGAQPPARTSAVTEALGYVGGVLVVVASILLVGTLWDHLSVAAQLGLVGGGAVLLAVAGALMPAQRGSVGERVRAALWLLSTGAAAFFFARVAIDGFDLKGPDVALFVTAGGAFDAAILWWSSRHVAQQAACFGFLAGTAAAALAELGWTGSRGGSIPGVGILAVGAAWLLLAGRGPLVPESVARVLGAVGVVAGAASSQGWGVTRPLSLLAIAGLVAFATWRSDLVLLTIATVGILVVLPVSVVAWFPGAVSAPLAILVTGAALVLLALRMVRTRR